MRARSKEIEVVDWVDKTGSDWQMVKFVQWQYSDQRNWMW